MCAKNYILEKFFFISLYKAYSIGIKYKKFSLHDWLMHVGKEATKNYNFSNKFKILKIFLLL